MIAPGLPVTVAMVQVFETPAPTASATISERSTLDAQIDSIAVAAKAKTGGTLGVVVWDLGTSVLVQRNAEGPLPMASVFKLPLAFCAYRAIDRGKLRLDQRVTILPGDIVRGVSPIADAYPKVGAYSLRDLLGRMLVDSDNTAADVLYRLLGGPDAVNASLHEVGIDAMIVRTNEAGNAANEKSGRSFAKGGDNAASPAAVALLLSDIYRGTTLSAASRGALLETLAQVNTGPARLRAGLPPKTRFMHKTGTTGSFAGVVDATNDVGIAEINGRTVILVAMLYNARGTTAQREAFLAQIARSASDATRLFPI